MYEWDLFLDMLTAVSNWQEWVAMSHSHTHTHFVCDLEWFKLVFIRNYSIQSIDKNDIYMRSVCLSLSLCVPSGVSGDSIEFKPEKEKDGAEVAMNGEHT